MIAQEVMTFKAQKQGLAASNNGASNLKRKESLSANDRETFARSTDGSKDNSHRNSSSIAASAAPVQQQHHQNMDVDALERELGGGI